MLVSRMEDIPELHPNMPMFSLPMHIAQLDGTHQFSGLGLSIRSPTRRVAHLATSPRTTRPTPGDLARRSAALRSLRLFSAPVAADVPPSGGSKERSPVEACKVCMPSLAQQRAGSSSGAKSTGASARPIPSAALRAHSIRAAYC